MSWAAEAIRFAPMRRIASRTLSCLRKRNDMSEKKGATRTGGHAPCERSRESALFDLDLLGLLLRADHLGDVHRQDSILAFAADGALIDAVWQGEAAC